MRKVKHLVEHQSELEIDPTKELRDHLHALIDLLLAVLVSDESSRRLVLHAVLTPDELAERLKVPRSTIDEMARAGKLPGAFRIGKHWRFDLDVLRANLSTVET